MPIWNPRVETMPRSELEQLQLERLQATINRVWDSVPFYRRRFEELGLQPEHIRSLDDLRLLPFTEKEDLRQGYPYDLFALPLREVVRIHASSGTTGPPTVAGYTKNDLQNWSELVARVLSAGGATKEDVIQISFSYGLLTDAFGFHQGAEEIGASVIPVSAGAPEQQVKILRDFRSTVLVGTPADALRIADALEELKVPRTSLHLRWGMFGSAPWSEGTRQRIESLLGISATDNYAISEMMGPGVSGECEQKEGLHVNEDHFLCEIIDPDSGEVLPPGETGEMVITSLTKEALPILRYRTRDLSSLDPSPCPCGRTLARMSRIFSRTDDLLIVGGTKLFPSQLEDVLQQVEGVEPHYRVIVDQKGGVDTVEVQVEVSSALLTGDVSQLLRVQKELQARLKQELGLQAELKLVESRTIGPVEHQAKRIVDRRLGEGGLSGETE
ncbi:MAG: phenylacetate--CoA ligase [Armatimonadetes bacterium]|nr:phenylacetate--CoA ligase [Armatimonadota bacterium]